MWNSKLWLTSLFFGYEIKIFFNSKKKKILTLSSVYILSLFFQVKIMENVFVENVNAMKVTKTQIVDVLQQTHLVSLLQVGYVFCYSLFYFTLFYLLKICVLYEQRKQLQVGHLSKSQVYKSVQHRKECIT